MKLLKSIKSFIKILNRFLIMHGLDIKRFFLSFRHFGQYIADMMMYKKLCRGPGGRFNICYKNLFPVFADYTESAGTISGHYTHQDLWAAKKIYKANPKRHIDIGSRIDGFITHLLVFRDVEVIDIRPLNSPYKELKFIQDDATLLSSFSDGEIESLSCLHAAEHFGLGRYGDPIDPDAHEKLLRSFSQKIKKDGMLYFSTPIGLERVEFNAHRVFNPLTILKLLADFDLVGFSVVNDKGDYIEKAKPEDYTECRFSCGLYELRKK